MDPDACVALSGLFFTPSEHLLQLISLHTHVYQPTPPHSPDHTGTNQPALLRAAFHAQRM